MVIVDVKGEYKFDSNNLIPTILKKRQIQHQRASPGSWGVHLKEDLRVGHRGLH